MEKCAQSMLRPPSSFASKTWTLFLAYLHLEFGQYAMSPLYLAVTVRCLVCGAMLGSTMDNARMAFGSIYNFYVTGWTWLLRSILAMLRLLVFLGNLYIISMSLLYFQLSSQSIFCASRFFGALEHSQL